MKKFNIIVKNYEHINSSFGNWDTPKGKYIRNKKQYDEEMKKGGYVPYKPREKKSSTWIPSADLKKTLRQLSCQKYVGGRLIEKMRKMGVCFNPRFMTNDLKGGIDASKE